jgi:hypothetical protein
MTDLKPLVSATESTMRVSEEQLETDVEPEVLLQSLIWELADSCDNHIKRLHRCECAEARLLAKKVVLEKILGDNRFWNLHAVTRKELERIVNLLDL